MPLGNPGTVSNRPDLGGYCALIFFIFFPQNARNHKDSNSLRNCREMKILLKNNSCNVVRTCFYFCSYVLRAILGCGYACGANSSFPTVTMWQKHSGVLTARRSHCSHMMAPMCPQPKPLYFSCPEPINEIIIGIAWTRPAEEFRSNFSGSVGLLIVQGEIQPCAEHRAAPQDGRTAQHNVQVTALQLLQKQ